MAVMAVLVLHLQLAVHPQLILAAVAALAVEAISHKVLVVQVAVVTLDYLALLVLPI
jgi:hypothetical protein